MNVRRRHLPARRYPWCSYTYRQESHQRPCAAFDVGAGRVGVCVSECGVGCQDGDGATRSVFQPLSLFPSTVYMYIYIYIYICIRIYEYIRVNICVYLNIFIHVHLYTKPDDVSGMENGGTMGGFRVSPLAAVLPWACPRPQMRA